MISGLDPRGPKSSSASREVARAIINVASYSSAFRRAVTLALSPKVWLMCVNRSTFPGPKTKLPPS